MLRFAGNEIGRLLMGLFGAALMAVAFGALGGGDAGRGSYSAAFADQLYAVVRGNFGISLLTGLPATFELRAHLPATLMLMGMGGLLGVFVGLPLGFLLLLDPIRRLGTPLLQAASAVPLFCAGLLLAFLAAMLTGGHGEGIPVVGQLFGGTDLAKAALPVTVVGVAGAGAIQLALRRAAAAEAETSWRETLRRLGLSSLEIRGIYVLPRILAGLFAHAGEIVLALLSASAVAEWLFFIPGAADLFIKSVASDDWNMAALVLFCFAGLYFVVDFFGKLVAYRLIGEAPAP
jgi:peptide/nickel transport system permease protein